MNSQHVVETSGNEFCGCDYTGILFTSAIMRLDAGVSKGGGRVLRLFLCMYVNLPSPKVPVSFGETSLLVTSSSMSKPLPARALSPGSKDSKNNG